MLDLPTVNVPHGVREIITRTFAHKLARPDHALILADNLDEWAASLPEGSRYIPTLRQCANAVREAAPHLDPDAAPGERRSPDPTATTEEA